MSVSGLAQKLASLFRPTANGTGDGEKTHSHVEEPRYIQFHHLEHDAVNEDGTPKLNKFSSTLTNNHDFPGAQAMLYAAGVPNEEAMKKAPQIGVATVWWEGNPCNTHLLQLGKIVKRSLENDGMIAWQYGTIGVSDGITMGHEGMRFSLQSREIIADSIETITCAQYHDACIAIPGCDKNMPGVVMAFARHNRPSIMVYGGTSKQGFSETLRKPINITTCYEVHGAFIYNTLESKHDPCIPPIDIMKDVERNACPGAGSCGGMYTANTMACCIEAMGLTLPNSACTPAEHPRKLRECEKAAKAIRVCMERDITPSKLLTREAFLNALVVLMALGGSTNAVLHLLAMAGSANVPLTLEDFQDQSNKIPVLANLKPSGEYLVADLYDIGGTPSIFKFLIECKLLNGDILTVTGETLRKNVENAPVLDPGQKIIRPLENPMKATGHIEILTGNIAPGGAVAKITGKEGLEFTGKALVFNKEHELDDALNAGKIPTVGNYVLVVRYEGPKGGPGMPEQLKASAAIMGAGLKNIALITDGRYSGASHGFIVGHICPEAAVGGPIAVIENGDEIAINATTNRIDMKVPDEEIKRRLTKWAVPVAPVTRGVLGKYARLVGDASHGAMTDLF